MSTEVSPGTWPSEGRGGPSRSTLCGRGINSGHSPRLSLSLVTRPVKAGGGIQEGLALQTLTALQVEDQGLGQWPRPVPTGAIRACGILPQDPRVREMGAAWTEAGCAHCSLRAAGHGLGRAEAQGSLPAAQQLLAWVRGGRGGAPPHPESWTWTRRL